MEEERTVPGQEELAETPGSSEVVAPQGEAETTPGTEQPSQQPTSEQKGKWVPLERLTEVQEKLKNLEPLAAIADMVKEDPNLIHELRARKLRKELGLPETGPVERPAPVQPSADEGANAEAVEKFVEALTPAFAKDPVRTMLAAAQAISRQESAKSAEPVQNLVVGLSIQNFKAEMNGDPFYKMAAPIFDAIVSNIPRKNFKGLDDAGVRALLTSTYHAASGLAMRRAYDEAVKSGKIKTGNGEQPNPPNYGGGGGGGKGPAKSKLSAEVLALAKASGLSQKEIDELEAEE